MPCHTEGSSKRPWIHLPVPRLLPSQFMIYLNIYEGHAESNGPHICFNIGGPKINLQNVGTKVPQFILNFWQNELFSWKTHWDNPINTICTICSYCFINHRPRLSA